MKKTTKGLLSALLLTAMCGAVGCKPVETSTGTPSTGTSSSTVVNVEAQNLLSSIVDSGDGCYTVTEADGKTTVALHMVAEVQKRGGIAGFIDAEHALDPVYAKKIGVDIK